MTLFETTFVSEVDGTNDAADVLLSRNEEVIVRLNWYRQAPICNISCNVDKLTFYILNILELLG